MYVTDQIWVLDIFSNLGYFFNCLKKGFLFFGV